MAEVQVEPTAKRRRVGEAEAAGPGDDTTAVHAARCLELASGLAALVRTSRLGEGRLLPATRQLVHQHSLLGAAVAKATDQLSAAANQEAYCSREAVLSSLTAQVRRAAEKLRRTIDSQQRCRPLVKSHDPQSGSAGEIVAYAHKISYTTFAPPSSSRGPFRPPAPQDWQLMRGKLHKHAAEAAAKAAALEQPPAQEAKPTEKPKASSTPAVPEMPAGWKPGDPIKVPDGWKPGDPIEMPAMPAGWKPGDPLPGLEGAPPMPHPSSSLPPAVPERTVSASVPPKAPVLGLLLNKEDMAALEDEEGEYTSEEESSDDD